MDCAVHEILQARILEEAFPFSMESSQLRDQTQVSCIAGGFFTSWVTRETLSLNVASAVAAAAKSRGSFWRTWVNWIHTDSQNKLSGRR